MPTTNPETNEELREAIINRLDSIVADLQDRDGYEVATKDIDDLINQHVAREAKAAQRQQSPFRTG